MSGLGGTRSDAVNPRPWLQRAPSSDVAFFNMVFETTQNISRIKEHGYRVLDEYAVCVAPLTGSDAVLRVEHQAPARNVWASANGWLIEYMGNVVAVVARRKVIWAVEFARDVRVVWWMNERTIGVATNGSKSALTLFVIDTASKQSQRLVRQVDLSTADSAGGPLQVAAQGTNIVCALADGRNSNLLWYWKIDPALDKDTIRTQDSGQLGSRSTTVVDLRWVSEAVGLAATESGGLWFTAEPRVAEVACDLRSLNTLSWRWQASVIAVNERQIVPPEQPMLCLPGASGMTCYRLDCQNPAIVQRKTFSEGWVWLCASVTAYAILSPCRRKAMVCRMPGGQPIVTIHVHELDSGVSVIQDAWILDNPAACALSTGNELYIVDLP